MMLLHANGCEDNWSKQSVKPGSVVGKQTCHTIHIMGLAKAFALPRWHCRLAAWSMLCPLLTKPYLPFNFHYSMVLNFLSHLNQT
jgi:hypothetical protein